MPRLFLSFLSLFTNVPEEEFSEGHIQDRAYKGAELARRRAKRLSGGPTPQPPALTSGPYLKRPDASNVSAVCISASDVSLADRVRLHAMLAERSRPVVVVVVVVVVVRTSEALN